MLEISAAALLPAATYVLLASCKGAVAVAFVLLCRRLFGDRLSAQVRFVMWLVVIASLLLPAGIHVPVRLPFDFPVVKSNAGMAMPAADFPSAAVPLPASPERVVQLQPTQVLPAQGSSDRLPFHSWLILLWVVIATALAVVSARNLLRYRRIAALSQPVSGAAWELLLQCKTRMALRSDVRLLESSDIQSPAIFGWLLPTLILPAGFKEQLDTAQLRHVFLHELAHVKRHDILSNWLMTCAQILHWFNPLVWYGLRVMRSDMEQACDARVLAGLPSPEHTDYGRTLITVMDSFPGRASTQGLGVVESRAQLRDRIRRIANFSSRKGAPPAFAGMLLVGLASVAATAPQIDTKSPGSVIETPPAKAPAAGNAIPPAQSAAPAPATEVVQRRPETTLKIMPLQGVAGGLGPISVKATLVSSTAGTLLFENVEMKQGDMLVRANRAQVTGAVKDKFDNSTWNLTGDVRMEFNRSVLNAQSAILEIVDGGLTVRAYNFVAVSTPPAKITMAPAAQQKALAPQEPVETAAVSPAEAPGVTRIFAAFRTIVGMADRNQAGEPPGGREAMRATMLRSVGVDPADSRVSLAGLRQLVEEDGEVTARATAALCLRKHELVTADAFQDAMLRMTGEIASWRNRKSRELGAPPTNATAVNIGGARLLSGVEWEGWKGVEADYRRGFPDRIAEMCPGAAD